MDAVRLPLVALLALVVSTEAALVSRVASRSRSPVCMSSEAKPCTLIDELRMATAAAGQVASDATDEQQAAVESAASALRDIGTDQDVPATVPLKGKYRLLYSASKGGSSGKLGPFTGKVSQIILDDSRFINQVELAGGAITIRLQAVREVLDSTRIRVTFVETSFSLFGNELFKKPTTGSGVWTNWFVSEGGDGAAELRVMETPSLFVLEREA